MARCKVDPPEILAFYEWMRANRYSELSINIMKHKIRRVYRDYPRFDNMPKYPDGLSYIYMTEPRKSTSAIRQYRRTFNRLYDFLEDVNAR